MTTHTNNKKPSTFKIGQNVVVLRDGPSDPKFGVIYNRSVDAMGIETYDVYIHGEEIIEDHSATSVDGSSDGTSVQLMAPGTPESYCGGDYDMFSDGAEVQHKDGSTVSIAAKESTNDLGKRTYLGHRRGGFLEDFTEDDFV